MIPNPSFSELPRHKMKVLDVRTQTRSANDPVFKNNLEMKLEKLSTEELFLKRNAHQINHDLGYRIAANVDTPIIDAICKEMASRGIDEKEYKQFLENRS